MTPAQFRFMIHMGFRAGVAKQEVHGYITNVLAKIGLAALGEKGPLEIEGKPEADHDQP